MVFGIGEGSMDIVLEKTAFKPGEEIKGKAVLKLNNPTKARGVLVILYREVDVGSGRHRTKQKQIISDAKLGGPKEYTSTEFPFTLRVPEGVISNMDPLSGFLANTFGMQLWVEAKLDLEAAFDISRRIRVAIKQ